GFAQNPRNPALFSILHGRLSSAWGNCSARQTELIPRRTEGLRRFKSNPFDIYFENDGDFIECSS
ncbi:MAG: hypothetical protein V4461_15700, partial [Pseudomonadota bacterium]